MAGLVLGTIALLFIGAAFQPERYKPILWTIIGLLVLGIAWQIIAIILRKKHARQVFAAIKERGLEDHINNFINRFSFELRSANVWAFRNHRVDWDRIKDLEKFLVDQGINLKKGKSGDVYSVLRYYIQRREEKLTNESIRREPQNFAALSGTEFEQLLYRLFESMGYAVQHIGQSGDQGGDLIINSAGERILVQAKCYRDWSTGNAAVQQVVGATKYYDCNKALVATTSHFTPEAVALAGANNVQLLPKERLQELLLEYLGESWS